MKPGLEERLLFLSMSVELTFGVTGVIFSEQAGSTAVLLDGAYSLICSITMIATIMVAKRIKQPPTTNFPLGQAALEPFLLSVEALILLTLCTALATHAGYKLINHSHPPNFSIALAYELASLITDLGMAFLIHRSARKINSPLLQFEAQEWILDGMLSAVALASFSVGEYLIEFPDIESLIDPVLTLVLIALVLPFPLKTLRTNINQLLWHSPEKELRLKMQQNIKRLDGYHCHLEPPVLLVMGRTLWITIRTSPIAGESPPEWPELENLKQRLRKDLQRDYPNYELHIQLTLGSSG
ncbi:cation transporter [Sansalvadorimonas sp. 2012CJ34-2]|uniref:Cation transporter n=1 Tax=Parendozoicomonas callyspongiae TaxID=2942213 RepID=A0ABT0PG66_9GAMM|nr:cation transporter [Sansalvadorimonas sp. 2012CJ34-2]MCL6270011.1 cation transporter [Sansalvadorimonas sp. 2012CJ34-2]